MHKIKKMTIVSVVVLIGVLLSLAGLNLIELSKELSLYSGAGLILLGAVVYFVY